MVSQVLAIRAKGTMVLIASNLIKVITSSITNQDIRVILSS